MIELLPYQEEALPVMESFDHRVLLAWDMGLGKTIVSLAAMQRNENLLPALIVCPASVKYNWEAEALQHFGWASSICEGRKPPKETRNSFVHSAPLTIINYDILSYWVKYLKKQKFKTIIVDECQRFQNLQAKRTQAGRQLCPGIQHAFFLSGTPITSKTSQFFPSLNMLWPDYYDSFFDFANEYCPPKLTPWGVTHSKSTNTKQLHQELKKLGMLRLKKADVLHDLPDKTRTIIPLEIKERNVYELCRDNFSLYLKKYRPEKMRKMLRAAALSQSGEILRLTAKLKIKQVVDWCNDFLKETREKLVIMAIHKAALDVLERHLDGKGVRIDGSVTGRKRQACIEQFRRDRETRWCIGNIQAVGEGTNGLQDSCSSMVIMELPYTPGLCDQVEARLDRIGQKQATNIYYLIARNTVEERLCRILQERQTVVKDVLDGGVSPQDLNLYEELNRLIEEEQNSFNSQPKRKGR